MTLVDTFEQLSNFGWSNIILMLLLVMVFTVVLIETFKKLPDILGFETKASIKEREREEEIAKIKAQISKNEQDITNLQNSAATFKSDRIHDREQSFQKQEYFENLFTTVTEKQDAIIERVDALAEQTRQYELADIRETLIQAHRYYANSTTNPMGAWTAMEAHAFWEQYNNYTQRGGNSYVKTTIAPAMHNLIEISMDDLERIAELMASRTKNKC